MPRPKDPREKRRLSLVLSVRTFELLEQLQMRIDAETMSGTIRQALKVLDLVTDGGYHLVHTESGNPVQLSV